MPKIIQQELEIKLICSKILNNFDLLQNMSLGNLIVDLRGNASGAGLAEVSKILKRREFDYVIVNNEHEASQVSRVSSHQILISSPSFATKPKHTVIVNSLAELYSVKNICNIHINLQTGRSPKGLSVNNISLALEYLKMNPRISLEGVMSELDDPSAEDTSLMRHQIRTFDKIVETILDAGFEPKYYHIADNVAVGRTIRSKYATHSRVSYTLLGINTLDQSDFDYNNLQVLQKAYALEARLHPTDQDRFFYINIDKRYIDLIACINDQKLPLQYSSNCYFIEIGTLIAPSICVVQARSGEGIDEYQLMNSMDSNINRSIVWK